MTELTSTTPREALELYLSDKQIDHASSTVRSHRSRLGHFVDWCGQTGAEDLNTLTERDVQNYRRWRADGINRVTLKTQMDTLRVFLRYCEDINAVTQGLSESVRSPNLGEENQRSTMLPQDRATTVLTHLQKYEYATLSHTLIEVMWRTGIRIGAAHSLDTEDVQEDPHLRLRHRPESDTTLKNGPDGERRVSIRDTTLDTIHDYIQTTQPDVEDDYGRTPLFSSRYGRMHKTALRERVYGWTRPCEITGECPHGRVIDECTAAESRQEASKCPSSVSPHAIRRGSITHHLREDTPTRVVSDRMNVSPDTLEKHYDERSEEGKMSQRRDHLPDG